MGCECVCALDNACDCDNVFACFQTQPCWRELLQIAVSCSRRRCKDEGVSQQRRRRFLWKLLMPGGDRAALMALEIEIDVMEASGAIWNALKFVDRRCLSQ